jgi:DNA-binding transcriptional LysR family regulator
VNVSAIDLNLLRTLDALLAERSVTRAGRKIGLSQPATSNALARLRTLFDDPLLVRTAGGMRPTARARALAKPLAQALASLAQAIGEPAPFDPATAVATITLGVTDYSALVVVPPLIAALHARAPGIDLRVRSLTGTPGLAGLRTGDLDLAIAPVPQAPPRLRAQLVFRDRLCSIVRRGHPLAARSRLSIEQFARAEHVLTSIGDTPSPVDLALQRRGLARHIAVQVPQFTVVPLVVLGSDLIATVPERLARGFAGLGLAILRPPLRLPALQMKMLWHDSRDDEPAHRWSRELLGTLFRPLAA